MGEWGVLYKALWVEKCSTISSLFLFTLLWTHQEQLWVQYLVQGYFCMQTGAARNQNTNLPVSSLLYLLSHSQPWNSIQYAHWIEFQGWLIISEMCTHTNTHQCLVSKYHTASQKLNCYAAWHKSLFSINRKAKFHWNRERDVLVQRYIKLGEEKTVIPLWHKTENLREV